MRSNYYKWTIGIQCFKMFSNVISDFIAQQNVNKIKTVYTAISSTFTILWKSTLKDNTHVDVRKIYNGILFKIKLWRKESLDVLYHNFYVHLNLNDRRCCDNMVLGSTTIHSTSAYHH
jgi:hypothetical protein